MAKILITGSHFTPAQAVIEKLQLDPGNKIVYVGRKHTREGDKSLSMESQVLPKLGVKFISLTSGRLQRSFTIHTIPSLVKIPIGFIQSFFIILWEKPDVVLSFGGYVSVPVVISAWFLSIPIIIHEQTLVTGLANKITSWFANKIATSFDTNYSFNKNKVVLTGNPIRKSIISSEKNTSKDISEFISAATKSNMPVVLVTGGNQGSHIINETVGNIIDELILKCFVIHQTGDSKFKDYETLVNKNSKKYLARKWLTDSEMGFILNNTDLVVCRPGANTLLELSYFGIPSLVIPIAGHFEQNANAKYFEKEGLAHPLSQLQLTSQNLLDKLMSMLKDLNNLKKDASNAKSLVIKDAAARVALETTLLVK